MHYDFKYGGLTYDDDGQYTDFWFYENAVGHDLRDWTLTYAWEDRRFVGVLRMCENVDAELMDHRSFTRDEVKEMVALLPLEWKLRFALFNNPKE